MRNNCLLILCLCLLAEGIYAQNADKGKNVTKNSVSTAQKTNAALREARFDPRKPQLSADQVKQVDNRIRREFLQYQFPATLEEYGKQEKRMTEITAFRTATSLRHMISHPDLEEVMKVPKAWYQSYYAQVSPLEKIALNVVNASRNDNPEKYAAAVAEFKKQQAACLAFLKKKQPKITSEQLMKIRNANIRRRRAEYNARIKKEREEQLKKLQEEKSQKNTNK